MRRWLPLLVVLGCQSNPPPPGDEQMGSFEFHSMRTGGSCPFVEIPSDAGFNFGASFSRFRDAGIYYVTIGGVPHEASFDGQRIRAEYKAQRSFSQCGGCLGSDAGVPPLLTMTETMIVTLVSRSQSDAVGGCAENPPVDPDAGIVLPGSTAEGTFDAVRACGILSEQVGLVPQVMSPPPPMCLIECNACTYEFAIAGDRR